MKKTLIALCGALTLAAFADSAEPAPSAEAKCPCRPSAEAGARPKRGPMQRPPMLTLSEKTTAEDIAAFKAEVAKKIDETAAAYAAKSGEDKKPVRIVLFNLPKLPAVFGRIFAEAFGLRQAVAGGFGAVLMNGVKRGLFSNEAGSGSAPCAAAAAGRGYGERDGRCR